MPKVIAPISCFDDSSDINLNKVIFAANQVSVNLKNPYVGNKKKILVDIWNFSGIKQSVKFLDLFSGSSSVGLFFKLLGNSVYSNELLFSSYLNSFVYIENDCLFLSEQEKEFLTNNKNKNNDNFIKNNYCNKRFSEKECEFLDNYYFNTLEINDVKKQYLAHLSILNFIMNYCFVGGRLNNGQIIADLEHRINHDRNKGNELLFNSINFIDTSFIEKSKIRDLKKCESYNKDVFSFLKEFNFSEWNEKDIIYIDPPYGGNQSDYMFMYSFCEEYLFRKNINDISYANESKSFIKSKSYTEQFNFLCSKLPLNVKWIFSYNDSSWGNIEEIVKNINFYKKNIDINEIDYSYNYRSKKNKKSKEYLIVAY